VQPARELRLQQSILLRIVSASTHSACAHPWIPYVRILMICQKINSIRTGFSIFVRKPHC
jgi:hypothetical protein